MFREISIIDKIFELRYKYEYEYESNLYFKRASGIGLTKEDYRALKKEFELTNMNAQDGRITHVCGLEILSTDADKTEVI